MNRIGRGLDWHWAQDEWLRWCARKGRSAQWISETMPGRSEEAIKCRARLVLRVKLAPRAPSGHPVGQKIVHSGSFKAGNPGYWLRFPEVINP